MGSNERKRSRTRTPLSDQHHHHRNNHQETTKKRQPSASSTSTPPPNPQSTSNPTTQRPNFPSYQDTPNLPPKVKLLCEIIAKTPSSSIETVLEDASVIVCSTDVEQALKLSYSFPGPAVKFFRWAGHKLQDNHSPYSWNLVVDILGKNSLFEAMWEAIKSMNKSGLVSLATFASVFSSYVIANKVQEAILTLEVMDKYGCSCNIVALNSLLSAICRDGKTVDAMEFLHVAKNVIRPDADTYAILLEGWEKEMNVVNSRQVFMQMVNDIGWDPHNISAYDTFLCTLLMGRDGLDEAVEFLKMMSERRCCPGIRFFRAALEECLKFNDVKRGILIWEIMVAKNGFKPDTELYNLMIALHCCTSNVDVGQKLFDEMIYNGAFPDRQSYNILFQFFIKSRKLKDASMVFNEMIKNECIPNQGNCAAAVRVYLHGKEPYMAIKVWKCMIENYESDLEETGNLLVLGLCDLSMDPEAAKYAEGMIEKGIRLTSNTFATLKQNLTRGRREFVYEARVKRLKAH